MRYTPGSFAQSNRDSLDVDLVLLLQASRHHIGVMIFVGVKELLQASRTMSTDGMAQMDLVP